MHENAPVPPIVYNYCPAKRGIEILTKLRIKVTPPAEFNDPFECNPHFVPMDRHFTRGKSRLFKKKLNETYEKVRHGMKTTASERLGAFCTSGPSDHPLLWAHYADSHRGIKIGFDPGTLAQVSKPNGESHLGKLWPVNYSEERPFLPPSIISEQAEQAIDRYTQACISKSIEWEYEDEFRLFFSLPLLTPEIFIETPLFFAPISPNIVRHVVLGVNCSAATERCIRIILRDKNFKHVRFQRSFLSEKTYSIELKNAPRNFR